MTKLKLDLAWMHSKSSTDDYAKDGGPRGSDFCVLFAISLYALESKHALMSLQGVVGAILIICV